MGMHVWKAAAAVVLISAVLASRPEPAQAQAQSVQTVTLTCSFIRLQCLDECEDRGPKFFCRNYCRKMRASCMSSGNWHGWFGDRFDGVARE